MFCFSGVHAVVQGRGQHDASSLRSSVDVQRNFTAENSEPSGVLKGFISRVESSRAQKNPEGIAASRHRERQTPRNASWSGVWAGVRGPG